MVRVTGQVPWETDCEVKIFMQEVQQGMFSGAIPTRELGKQNWAEGQVKLT